MIDHAVICEDFHIDSQCALYHDFRPEPPHTNSPPRVRGDPALICAERIQRNGHCVIVPIKDTRNTRLIDSIKDGNGIYAQFAFQVVLLGNSR
jgi:hypothetical protein